jgi:mono/diheme cytochrome c family protein
MFSARNKLVVSCVAALSISAAWVIHGEPGRGVEPAQQAAQDVAAAGNFFEGYCVGCHNEDTQMAPGLMFDKMDVANLDKNRETWERVVRKLRAGMMPPAGRSRPDKATYQWQIAWLENQLDKTAPTHLPPPGLHRLNRAEYAFAIKDVLDIEIDPARFLPTDDSTSGFDNMAGTLKLSSTLVEAYVSAAQKISQLALGAATAATQVMYRAPEDTSQDYHIEGLPFGTRGGMIIKHVFPSDGDYTLNISPISGDNMSPGGFGSVQGERLEVLLDGKRLTEQPLNFGGGRGSRGATRVQFKTTAGLHTIGVTFIQTNLAPILDIDSHFMRDTIQTGPFPGYTFFPHVGSVRVDGPFNAVTAKDSPSRRRLMVCQPTGAADEAACAEKIVTALIGRAFRRPATQQEVSAMMEFYREGRKDGGTFDLGIEMVLARVLAAPQFIYRIEGEPAGLKDGEVYSITDLELASRLSYFLWSRGPDEELVQAAVQGKLKDPAVLEKQTLRMLKDPRSEALAVNFAGQWLNLRGMAAVGPLPMIYPNFDDPLRQAMRREVELLFDSVVHENRSITDLLTADYTFVNERLAKHYGIPNIYGSQFRRITLGPDLDIRRGLLGKGAILVTSSKPDRTSPVTRGKWVMTNLIGMRPPDPPPNVPPLPTKAVDVTGNKREPTMREKMTEHRVRADCIQCHRLMDPIGFTLENFDGIASWRMTDEGTPINNSDTLYDGTNVTGPAGLRQWLVGYSDQFVEVAAEKLLTYALGRGVEYQDMPLVRTIARDAARDNNRFAALVMGVVRSAPFQKNMKVKDSE